MRELDAITGWESSKGFNKKKSLMMFKEGSIQDQTMEKCYLIFFFSFICFVYFIGYKIEEEMPNLSKTKVQTNFDSLYSKIIYSFIFSVNRLRER
jgi:hypothetical protein